MNKDTDTFDPELFNIRNFGTPTRQHQKDWGSVWNVGEIGHSNGTALSFFPKIQLLATEWVTSSVHSFTSPP